MYREERPWGEFENLLEAEYCKVKRITVQPGHRLSYQYHNHRSEVWTIVQGTATMILDDFKFSVDSGEIVEIPKGMKHRVENRGPDTLIFIEVQHGTYFGEDDIVRLSDDYDRS